MTRFAELLRLLAEHEVDFILVGGLAAIAHGAGRMTEDVDIVYERSDENLQRIVEALADISPYLRGAPPGLPFHWDSETLRRGLNFRLSTDRGSIDLLGEISGGGGYEDLAEHSIELESRVPLPGPPEADRGQTSCWPPKGPGGHCRTGSTPRRIGPLRLGRRDAAALAFLGLAVSSPSSRHDDLAAIIRCPESAA